MASNALNNEVSGLTRQRRVVLEVVRECGSHPTASDVFSLAKAKTPSISYATVYNSLRYLKDAGHITEINFGRGASRFDAVTHRHDHAVCTECDALVDIEMDIPSDLVKRAAEYSQFRPESIEFTLRGKCSRCRGEEEAAPAARLRSYKAKQLSKFSRRSSSRLIK